MDKYKVKNGILYALGKFKITLIYMHWYVEFPVLFSAEFSQLKNKRAGITKMFSLILYPNLYKYPVLPGQ